MVRFVFLGTALLTASLAAPAAPPRTESLIPSTRYTLKNGLRVVLHEDRSQPLVAVRVLYQVGHRDDPPGQQGLAHLLEHNLFGVTKHLEIPVSSELARMHAIGANGTTEDDVMQLFEVVPSTSVRAAIRLESERMGHARFKFDKVEDEKRIIIRELAERRDNLQWGAALQTALRTLYPTAHPLHPSTGNTLAPITLGDVEEFDRWAITPSNAVLVLAGDLPSDTEDRIEQYFGRLLPGPDVSKSELPPVEFAKTVRKEIRGAAGTEALTLLLWPLQEHDAAVAVVTNAVLTRRFSRRNALAPGNRSDAVHNMTLPLRFGGRTFGLASIGGGRASRELLEAELRAALLEMVEHPPTTDELEAALKRRRVAALSQLDSLEARAEFLARSEANGAPRDEISSSSVTPAHVRRFVDTQLLRAPSLVVLQTPPSGR